MVHKIEKVFKLRKYVLIILILGRLLNVSKFKLQYPLKKLTSVFNVRIKHILTFERSFLEAMSQKSYVDEAVPLLHNSYFSLNAQMQIPQISFVFFLYTNKGLILINIKTLTIQNKKTKHVRDVFKAPFSCPTCLCCSWVIIPFDHHCSCRMTLLAFIQSAWHPVSIIYPWIWKALTVWVLYQRWIISLKTQVQRLENVPPQYQQDIEQNHKQWHNEEAPRNNQNLCKHQVTMTLHIMKCVYVSTKSYFPLHAFKPLIDYL